MKKLSVFPILFLLLSMLESCQVVGGIFKAGMWFGVIIVVAVIALVIWLISRAGK